MSWIKFIVQLPFFWLLLSSIFTIIFYKRGRGLGFYLSILLTGFWLVSMTPMGASLWFSSLTVFVKDSDTACRGEIKAVIVMPGGLSRRKEHSNNRLSVWSVNRANTALSLMGNGAVNTVIIPGGHHARDGKLEADVIQGFFQQRISGINYILGSRSN
ncbi:MAG: hypothetical protein HRU20_29100, partial [Pseudomonadales bacterium]|nr:hypothetical protein [Pseudomonadales bacterium]